MSLQLFTNNGLTIAYFAIIGQNGRWLHPSLIFPTNFTTAREKIDRNNLFEVGSWPLLWQPYDCQILWLNKQDSKMCMSQKEFIFIGISRERTNFFDFADFDEKKFQYQKLLATKSLDNLHYVSLYSNLLSDMKTWNKDITVLSVVDGINKELKNFSICGHQYNSRKVHIMYTEGALLISENAFRSQWYNISLKIFKAIKDSCPNAILHYKTASAIRSQYGSLSWQRLWEFSRLGASIAEAHNISIIDSFAMTQSLIMESDIYPDSVHLYSKHLVGNFVSKTISKMFLLQACTNVLYN